MVTITSVNYLIKGGQNVAKVTVLADCSVVVSGDSVSYIGTSGIFTLYPKTDDALYEVTKGQVIVGVILRVHTPTVEQSGKSFIDFIPGEPDEEELFAKAKREREYRQEDEIPLNCLIVKRIEMDFGFVNDITLKVVEEKAPRAAVKVELPTGNIVRLYKNGAMYPSPELTAERSLEYLPKDSEGVQNGMDFFKSVDFSMIPKGVNPFIVCAFAPKSASRISAFGGVKYVKEGEGVDPATVGNPTSSVLEQGATTFGKQLLEIVADVYGLMCGEAGYMDLEVVVASPLVSANGIYQLPKAVARGDKKGELSYVRRDNIDVYPLGVVESTALPYVAKEKEEKEETPCEEATKDQPACDNVIEGSGDVAPQEPTEETNVLVPEPFEAPVEEPVAEDDPFAGM